VVFTVIILLTFTRATRLLVRPSSCYRDLSPILLWSPYGIRQAIMFLPCGFFLSSFLPRLISAVADWMWP